MRKFISRLIVAFAAVVIAFSTVPVTEADSAVPQNVRVPMPIPSEYDWRVSEWAINFANSFFPDRPDERMFVPGSPNRFISAVGFYPNSQVTRFHILHYDDTLWAWGNNYRGGLGDGTAIDRVTPVLILNNVLYST